MQSETICKPYLETLLAAVSPSEAPQTRSQARKRKRSPDPLSLEVVFKTTPVDSLFIEGMDDDQIWSQLDLRTNNICEVLDKILDKEPDEEDLEKEDSGFEEGDDEEDDEEFDEKLEEAIRRMKSGEDVDFAELGLDESLKELVLEGAFDDDEDDSDLDDDGEEEGDRSIDSEDDNVEEEVALRDSSSDRGDVITRKSSIQNRKRARPGHPELDDSFFDLNAFNSQTEQFEAKNASSGILDDENQEYAEEEVDLFAPIDLQEGEDSDSENNSNSMRTFHIPVFTC